MVAAFKSETRYVAAPFHSNDLDLREAKHYGHIVLRALMTLDDARAAKAEYRRCLNHETLGPDARVSVEKAHDKAARMVTSATLDLGLALDAERDA